MHATTPFMTDTVSAEWNPGWQPTRKRLNIWRRLRVWHRRHITGPFDSSSILERVHEDAHWSGRYAFMIAMSAGIAILGLLLSSPAVIIGAMLVSPLMGPIVGLGLSLATIDWAEVRKSIVALAAGSALAVLLCTFLVLASPLKDMTPEILARTRPNLFDLLVAVFSGLAGGYATVRGRGEAIVGVAIATALMPPLAVVGYGIATGNVPVLSGAFALFLTNFLAISLAAGLVARFFGFGSALTPRQSKGQLAALLVLAVVLATPLFFSLRQIAWEALASRSMRTALNQEFGGSGRISSLDPNFSGSEVVVRATVLTDRYHDKAKVDLERRLGDTMKRRVRMELNQVLVNQSDAQTDLDRARTMEAHNRDDLVARADMAARLSLVSGVAVTDVLVDPIARVASVQSLPGQSLAQVMDSEERLAANSPGWTIKLLPPAGPFPPIDLSVAEFSTGKEEERTELADSDRSDVKAIVWALERLGTDSIRVTARQLSGEPRARAVERGTRVADALREKGLNVELSPPLPVDRQLERAKGTASMVAVQLEPLARSAQPEADGKENGSAAINQSRKQEV